MESRLTRFHAFHNQQCFQLTVKKQIVFCLKIDAYARQLIIWFAKPILFFLILLEFQ